MSCDCIRMLSYLYVFTFMCLYYTNIEGSQHQHVRTKRQADIANLSPNDRASCKPGAAIPVSRVSTSQRLSDLRAQFNVNGINIQGYIIPTEDAHQSEYPAEYDKRREYITGFSGSHGLAIVMKDKAAVWTDGRYYTQAEQELDCNWILMKQDEPETPTYEEWISAVLGTSGSVTNRYVGLNPLYITSTEWLSMEENLKKDNIILQQLMNRDLIDTIWTSGRPTMPSSTIDALPVQFAGRSWQQKVTEDVYTAMVEQSVDALILTQLDEIAWLFNLRGRDILYNPFFMAYALVEIQTAGQLSVRLFIWDRLRKLTEQPYEPETKLRLNQHLNTGVTGLCDSAVGMCVEVEDYSNFLNAVTALNSKARIKKFWLSHQCNHAIYRVISKEKYIANTPVVTKKFHKNPVEREGLRNSHKRDAVALITYLAKLEDKVKNQKYPVATELSVSNDLKNLRKLQQYNRGVSFETIAAYGSNGAVIHYSPTLSSNVEITTDKMFLLDSGGQYLDGTTDVTRTLHYGTPTEFEKECYTRVLMGHIDLARFTFYKGLYGPYGREIDAIARRPLWEVGLDYRHGTGHGVGAYLSVHEGPGRISLANPRVARDVPLDEFQVFSDEPGYYEPGKFGVRLENMVMVKKATTKYQFMNSEFLGFETLTLVPYEPNLVDFSLMSPAQIDWMNDYHNRILTEIGPLIANDTLATAWLRERTQRVTINSSNNVHCSATLMLLSLSVLFISL